MEELPTIESTLTPEAKSPVSRGRWWLHLALIGLYPVVIIGIGYLRRGGERQGTALPNTISGLLLVALIELGLFGMVFFSAWLASRANVDQLMLRWRRGLLPVGLGIVYSVALRVLVTVCVIGLLLAYFVVQGGMKSGSGAQKMTEKLAAKMRPQTEVLFDAKVLVKNPVYFALMLTLISFVVAGLREELWRAGVLAGIAALFPKWYNHVAGKLFAVAMVAVVFGLGHSPQGWGAVGLTTLLGFGLGGIMVFHQSVWVAALAHGFFDATTFVMIYCLARFWPGQIPGM